MIFKRGEVFYDGSGIFPPTKYTYIEPTASGKHWLAVEESNFAGNFGAGMVEADIQMIDGVWRVIL